MRARSPSSEPPLRRDEGSTASTATLSPAARHAPMSSDSSDDLPAPGGPVTPTMCPFASPPSAAGETLRSSAAICGARRGRAVLHEVQDLGSGGQVAAAQALAERGAVGQGHRAGTLAGCA